MAVPSREARLAHARIHCQYWNEGKREEWLASWATIAQGEVTMFDPVGTKEKHGLAHATSEAWDMFQQHLRMNMVVVHVNGDEMAWVIECLFSANGETLRTHSIETFAWDRVGNLTIKTYYDMPESVSAEDDPYEHLLGAENVIPNTGDGRGTDDDLQLLADGAATLHGGGGSYALTGLAVRRSGGRGIMRARTRCHQRGARDPDRSSEDGFPPCCGHSPPAGGSGAVWEACPGPTASILQDPPDGSAPQVPGALP